MARTTKRQEFSQAPLGPINENPMAWARSYQRALLYAFFIERRDRFLCVWNRKTGKDYIWALISKLYMFQKLKEQKSILVCHVLPTFNQAKKIIWDGPCDRGRFLDVVFPIEIRQDTSESECMIRLKDGYGGRTGPVYQLEGAAENMQKRRGPNASAVVLSEFQDMPPTVFGEIYEPMIISNRGWASFIGTPRGRNHFYKMAQYAKQQCGQTPSRWFYSFLTCLDTKKDAPGEDGTFVMPPEEIAEKRRRGEDEALIQQEDFCSWDGFAKGSIFGEWVHKARLEARIRQIERQVNMPVCCVLDIGRSDGTAILFYQRFANDIRIVDYLAFKANTIGSMSAAEYAIKRIKERPHITTRIVLPNDAQIRGYSAAESTLDVFRNAFPDVVLLDKLPVEQTINMARSIFPRLHFDAVYCALDQSDGMPSLLDSLSQYNRKLEAATGQYTGSPEHDENSHGADAFRYAAQDGFTAPEWYGMDAETKPDPGLYFNPLTYQRQSGRVPAFGVS